MRPSSSVCVPGGSTCSSSAAGSSAPASPSLRRGTGFAVALVERDDFASGTSSASSKLVHGGLRYLRMGHFGLVREALDEVRALSAVRRAAPRPAAPLRPAGVPRRPVRADPDPRRALVVRRPDRRRLRARAHDRCRARRSELVPSLRRDGLRAAGLYPDAQTDDARLTLANVRGRGRRGRRRPQPGRARRSRTGAGAEVAVDGARLVEVTARAVVNADRCLDRRGAAAGGSGRRHVGDAEQGLHLVLERAAEWDAAVTIPVEAARVVFAHSLGGDAARRDDRRAVRGRPARGRSDRRGGAADPGRGRRRGRPRRADAYAPLRGRPRPAGAAPADTLRAPRETMLSRGRLGMLSVAGGKLTTYRRIALAVLHALRPELDLHRIDRRPRPLPGASDPDVVADALRGGARTRSRRSRTPRPRLRDAGRGVIAAGPLEPLGPASPRSRRRCSTRASASGR